MDSDLIKAKPLFFYWEKFEEKIIINTVEDPL